MQDTLLTVPSGQYEFEIDEFRKTKHDNFEAQLLLQKADLYTNVHKGIRALMCDTLVKLGQMDCRDENEFSQTLNQLHDLIHVCELHLDDEEKFIHTAMAARSPGSERKTEEDHQHHQASLEKLLADTKVLELAAVPQRPILVGRLYQQLALFIADNFVHMHVEETENGSVLCRSFSTEELAFIHKELVGSLPPKAVMMFLNWMIPAISPNERAIMLKGLKRDAPQGAFVAIISDLTTQLSENNLEKLRVEKIF